MDTVLNLDNGNSIFYGRNRVCVFPQRSRNFARRAIFQANGISAARDFLRSWALEANNYCASKESREGEMIKTKRYSHWNSQSLRKVRFCHQDTQSLKLTLSKSLTNKLLTFVKLMKWEIWAVRNRLFISCSPRFFCLVFDPACNHVSRLLFVFRGEQFYRKQNRNFWTNSCYCTIKQVKCATKIISLTYLP